MSQMRMSFKEIVQDVFRYHGWPVDNDDYIGYVLWNHTGYPSFWHSEDVEACVRYQVHCFCAGICSGCEGPLDKTGYCPRCHLNEDPDDIPERRGKWDD
jgi:hypothetical protein